MKQLILFLLLLPAVLFGQAANDLIINQQKSSGTGSIQRNIGIGTAGQVMTSNGAGLAPSMQNSSAATAITAAVAADAADRFWLSTGASRAVQYKTLAEITTMIFSQTITQIDATTVNVSAIQPASNDGAALGSTSRQFSDLFLAEGGVINWDAGDATITQAGNVVTLAGAGLTLSETTSLLLGTAGSAVGNIGFRNATSGTITLAPATGALGTVTLTLPAVTATLATLTGTETLTNKRVTARITSIASSATPTVNTDDCDVVTITALAAAITSMTTNLTGTPANFDQLEYRILDNGTARAITWGASFASGTATLPTTTVLGKALCVYLEWDSVQAKWMCQATGSYP